MDIKIKKIIKKFCCFFTPLKHFLRNISIFYIEDYNYHIKYIYIHTYYYYYIIYIIILFTYYMLVPKSC